MPEKSAMVRFRINPSIKEALEKKVSESNEYDNLSELIRSVLIDFCSGKLTYSSHKQRKAKEIDKSEILDTMKKVIEETEDKILKSQKKTESRVMQFIQYVENGLQTFPTDLSNKEFKWNIEEGIIKLIEAKPMTSEQLAKIFNMTEPRILEFLNPMLKKKIIGLNKQLEYVLVETNQHKKELNFGDK